MVLVTSKWVLEFRLPGIQEVRILVQMVWGNQLGNAHFPEIFRNKGNSGKIPGDLE